MSEKDVNEIDPFAPLYHRWPRRFGIAGSNNITTKVQRTDIDGNPYISDFTQPIAKYLTSETSRVDRTIIKIYVIHLLQTAESPGFRNVLKRAFICDPLIPENISNKLNEIQRTIEAHAMALGNLDTERDGDFIRKTILQSTS